jgi:nucleotide-binding universal stress UspA family protein
MPTARVLTAQETTGRPTVISRIAVGVDGLPEGNDAAVLAKSMALLAHAELVLVGVHPEPLVVLPEEMNWTSLERQTEAVLQKARDSFAPHARIEVESDFSVPQALARVVERERSDVLVVGSSRHAADGRVRIGKRTRQLLSHLKCALAIAPRGMRDRPGYELRKIGVGYDGLTESEAALALAGSLAHAADAELRVCSVVDDRVPSLGWSAIATAGSEIARWETSICAEMNRLRECGLKAARVTGTTAEVEVLRGRPADALLALSKDVDLLVIGSRRWGAVARLLLGSTGEALAQDSACPLVIVPRPAA